MFVGGGYAGLEALAELQDFAAEAIEILSPRAPARDALDPGRGDGPGPARDRPRARRLCAARAARAGDRHPARDDARGGDGHTRRGSRPARPSPRGPSSGPPASSRIRAAATSACRSTSAGASSSTTTCACRARTTCGRSATPPRSPTRRSPAGPARRPRSTRSGREGPPGATSPRRSVSASPRPFTYKTLGRVREPRPLQGGGASGAVHVARLPGLVAGAHATT